MAPVLDEEKKVAEVVRRMPRDVVDEVLVVDDGSTDRSADVARELGATVISLGSCQGVGAAIRTGYRYALDHGYDVAVVVAGNNKDAPEEIPALVDPIAEDRADFVQGSRWLAPGADFGAMPAYRRVATRVHPLLFSAAARRRVTDSTNGFRALRTTLLRDPSIDLDQRWLDEYELEPYLFLRAIRSGHRVTEVPVTKVYPPRDQGRQTKMKPLVGWWSILRPLLYVGLGLRRQPRPLRRSAS
ncbi:MAG TPA: glycosyltransferase family 2 protein [Acidimicrobiales bacterium]|nr:glycosyltransferase family 2 protein [Acidimicrobiales bacterium]